MTTPLVSVTVVRTVHVKVISWNWIKRESYCRLTDGRSLCVNRCHLFICCAFCSLDMAVGYFLLRSNICLLELNSFLFVCLEMRDQIKFSKELIWLTRAFSTPKTLDAGSSPVKEIFLNFVLPDRGGKIFTVFSCWAEGNFPILWANLERLISLLFPDPHFDPLCIQHSMA